MLGNDLEGDLRPPVGAAGGELRFLHGFPYHASPEFCKYLQQDTAKIHSAQGTRTRIGFQTPLVRGDNIFTPLILPKLQKPEKCLDSIHESPDSDPPTMEASSGNQGSDPPD
jgi:hypothetical protein